MEVTEKEIFEAFGLEAPEEQPEEQQGGNEPEVADPAESAEETGGNEPEVAEPAEEGKKELSMEERHANAARRRKEELEEAVKKAVEEDRKREKKRIDNFFERAGLTNSITGEKIKSLDEFDSWQKSYKSERMKRDLKAGTLSQEALQEMIDEAVGQNPTVRQAEEVMRAQREAQQAQQAAETKKKVEAELSEIGKLMPEVKSIEDALALPTGERFAELVRKGNTFFDAFLLANREQIDAKKNETARQQAQLNVRGKDHLTPPKSKGAGVAQAPSKEEMALYKLLNPEASAAEIERHYATYRSGK